MRNRKDLFIDFQTFGFDPNKCAIINCSMFVFDWGLFGTDPYSFKSIVSNVSTFKCSVKEQVTKHNFEVDSNSVDWWAGKSQNHKETIKPKKDDLSLEDFYDKITSHIENCPYVYWWTRNNMFDPVVLQRVSHSVGHQDLHSNKFKPWRVRDVSTYIDAKFDFTTDTNFIPLEDEELWKKEYLQHYSAHDIAADVMRLQAIYRAENDLPTTKQ